MMISPCSQWQADYRATNSVETLQTAPSNAETGNWYLWPPLRPEQSSYQAETWADGLISSSTSSSSSISKEHEVLRNICVNSIHSEQLVGTWTMQFAYAGVLVVEE